MSLFPFFRSSFHNRFFNKRSGMLNRESTRITQTGLTAFCFLWLCGCATSFIHSQYSGPGFSITDLKGTRLLLVVSSQVDVREYKSSFASAYKDGDGFSAYFSSFLADSLNAPGGALS